MNYMKMIRTFCLGYDRAWVNLLAYYKLNVMLGVFLINIYIVVIELLSQYSDEDTSLM